jgi:hypothetical protein
LNVLRAVHIDITVVFYNYTVIFLPRKLLSYRYLVHSI